MVSGLASYQHEKTVKRALRFAVNFEMQFRLSGDREWRKGRLRNISTTGLLFESQSRLDLDAVITVSIDLPGTGQAGVGLRVLGTSKVVRVVRQEAESEFLIGGKFLQSRLVRQQR